MLREVNGCVVPACEETGEAVENIKDNDWEAKAATERKLIGCVLCDVPIPGGVTLRLTLDATPKEKD